MAKSGRTIFISYSRKDKRWLDRLTVFLKPYHQRGLLKIWDDRQITPSVEWEPAIYSAIESAAAAVLLISADFLASDFIVGQELRLLREAQSRNTKILPLFVGPTQISAYPELARIEGLNTPDRPLSLLSKPKADETLSEAAGLVAQLLGPDEPTPPRQAEMIRRYEAVTTGLAMLKTLKTSVGDHTLTDLTERLEIKSRKLAYAVAEELANAGWTEKYKSSKGMSYRITVEGAEQLERLSSLASGRLMRQ